MELGPHVVDLADDTNAVDGGGPAGEVIGHPLADERELRVRHPSADLGEHFVDELLDRKLVGRVLIRRRHDRDGVIGAVPAAGEIVRVDAVRDD